MQKRFWILLSAIFSFLFLLASCESSQNSYTDFTITQENKNLIGFKGCENEELEIPETFKGEDGIFYKVVGIADYAFYSCTKLVSISLPNSITDIGENAFMSCSNLRKTYIESIGAWCNIKFENPQANPLSNHLNALYINETLISDVEIPDGTEEIFPNAFYGYKNLNSIVFPSSIKTIGTDAFYNCTNLNSIVFSEGLETINERAFCYCENLKSVYLPNGFKKLGNLAFSKCKLLVSVSMPNSTTHIGYYAFRWCTTYDFNFRGTIEEWNKIYLGNAWNPLYNLVISCTDGELKKMYPANSP